MTKTLTVYEPDNALKKGYLNIFREIGRDLKNNRWLTWQLFKRDFLAAYRQSFIGILWAFIIPIVSVSTFIILTQAGIVNEGDITVPYPIYAVLGTALWSLFSAGLSGCSNSLVSAGAMVTKVNFSKKSLVMASMGQAIVSFLIQLFLVIILFFIYGFIPDISILLAIPFIIPIILLTLGLGFFVAIFNGVVRDAGNIITLFVTFLMFLTPIYYALPESGILMQMASINPLYYLTSMPRELMLTGTISNWVGYAVSVLFAVALFIIGLMIFHLTETRVTERI